MRNLAVILVCIMRLELEWKRRGLDVRSEAKEVYLMVPGLYITTLCTNKYTILDIPKHHTRVNDHLG